MKLYKETTQAESARDFLNARIASVEALVSELETNGVVVLPSIIPVSQLREMQEAFGARLQNVRWNNFDGYQRTEVYRHMIEDVLVVAQGFVDLAVHPLVKQIVSAYVGPNYQLTEAKGWKSLPTARDFHGWHGDMWYDQSAGTPIHREIKLGMYLTDVRSGAFWFIKGTHRKQHPHNLKREEITALPLSELVEVKGPAGTVFLFDTSIVHRQGIPMLDSRQAIFYAYHDPAVVLQAEDVAYYRYHPLLLNAAFLGNLSEEDERILGFGDKRNFQPAFTRKDRPSIIYRAYAASLSLSLRYEQWRERMTARLARLTRANTPDHY